MDKPTRIRIGPIDYEIRWEDGEWERTANVLAQIDTKYAVIRMPARDMPKGAIASAFLHEIMHGIMYWTELNKELTEEKAANIGSYGMVDVWRDNPEIFDWIVSLVKGV